MKFYPVLLLSGLALISCVSYSVKETSPVPKVDGKVLEEFDESRENGDFYGTARSYIEFLNCCKDEREAELREELSLLYRDKVEEFKLEGRNLALVEHTYSYLNLMGSNLSQADRDRLVGELETYIETFVESDMKDMGSLEKISWLMYLDRFHLAGSGSATRSELVSLFLKRNNPYMAEKYMEYLREASQETDNERLEGEVSALKAKIDEISSAAIERTVLSSVKILVDRGIKTERGMGIPDQSLGTGIVIDDRGYILTNYHIIESDVDPSYEGYSRVYVLPERDENIRLVAKVVGYDAVFDLALLKIEREVQSLVMIGDSDTLKQGEKVVAVGNPVGLTNTVTSGVVSSTDRPFLQIGGIIQIDAALNPGNSGGALINKDGYLVGIAFAGLANFENLNFAIPSNHMITILRKLYTEDEVSRSWVGCALDQRDGDLIVEYIAPKSPAELSGVQNGDIIRSVNGRGVSSIFDIQDMFSNLNSPIIGNMIIDREGKLMNKRVVLAERPVQPAVHIYERDALEKIMVPLFGMVLSPMEPERKKNYIVTKTLNNSVATSVGVAEGDEIRIRDLKYDENAQVFYLVIDLKSKRFGYINRSMVLYRYIDVTTFI
jgi:S1-C subfamily serine protease